MEWLALMPLVAKDVVGQLPVPTPTSYPKRIRCDFGLPSFLTVSSM